MQLPSSLLENAVAQFSKLPGIGKKTALRLVLHLLKQEVTEVEQFGEAIARMRRDIKFCQRCNNISDGDICSICSNSVRKQNMICVVETIRDVIAIESTQQYIGPDQLNIETLVSRIEKEQTEELIFALNPNIQGDTTIYYIQKKIAHLTCHVTTIARGIAFGGELEYADEMTLARSFTNRLPVQHYVK